MNKWIGLGRLTKDLEIRYTESGKCVARFTLAINRNWSKENQQTDFIPIVVWGKLAEVCGEYLRKGQQIAIEGRIQVRNYEKDGQKRYMTEVIAENVEFIGKKPKENQSGNSGLPPSQQNLGNEVPFDEEIPF